MSFDLLVSLAILLVLFSFFVSIEAARLFMRPERGRVPFRYYLLGTLSVLEKTFFLVITIPLALIKKLRKG